MTGMARPVLRYIKKKSREEGNVVKILTALCVEVQKGEKEKARARLRPFVSLGEHLHHHLRVAHIREKGLRKDLGK